MRPDERVSAVPKSAMLFGVVSLDMLVINHANPVATVCGGAVLCVLMEVEVASGPSFVSSEETPLLARAWPCMRWAQVEPPFLPIAVSSQYRS